MSNATLGSVALGTITDDAELQESIQYLLDAVRSHGRDGEMVVTILRDSADQLMKRQPRGGGLTEEQATFLIDSGTFTAQSLAATETRVARGDLAELEQATRLEAITGSLSAVEVARKLGIDTSRVRHRQAKGNLYSFLVGNKRRYPAWQFTDDKAQPVLPGLTALLGSFPEDMHPASIQNIMLTPQRDLLVDARRLTPVEWLLLGRPPQDVVDIFDGFLQS